MLRVHVIFLLLLDLGISVLAECFYQDVLYAAGSAVPVREPCLRCICSRAALQCALRVCPPLPDPPPPGCILVHRRKRCCAELVCKDNAAKYNKIEARFEPGLPDIPNNDSEITKGCLHSGTLYAAGSAMLTSTRCSPCYCLGGKSHCTRPSCILPASGCAPVYQPHACCPTRYKCFSSNAADRNNDDSCFVKGAWYPAGSFITSAAHNPCDRCYCVRGAVRCTQLHCAPPLTGCTPLIPLGECCPSSYNCSGIIEVQPLLNFGNPPQLSSEYAKLRKESKHVPVTILNNPVTTKYPHYVLAESQILTQTLLKTSTPYYFTSTVKPSMVRVVPTSRQYLATTKHPWTDGNLSPENSEMYSKISLTTTRANGDKNVTETTESAEADRENSVIISPVYKPDNCTPNKVSLNCDNDINNDVYSDDRNNRRFGDDLERNGTDSTTYEYTTVTEITTNLDTGTSYFTTDFIVETTTDLLEDNATAISNITSQTLVPSIKLIGNNSECIDGPLEVELTTQNILEETTLNEITTIESETTFAASSVDNLQIFVENSSEIEIDDNSTTILPFEKNITESGAVNKKDEDYEYDYNLQPHLEIIPFVAADAVVDQDKKSATGGGSTESHEDPLKETSEPMFSYTVNLFSPPQETEGGFVPRDPPLINSFDLYQPDIGKEGGSTTTENTINKGDSCMVFGSEVQHGSSTESGSACTKCLCLFGLIMCQPSKCNESPPIQIMGRIDTTESTAAESDADPFRDVIRTEPAPDLHSLIGDLPLYQHHTKNSQEQQQKNAEIAEAKENEAIYDPLFQFLNIDADNTSMTSTTNSTSSPSPTIPWLVTTNNDGDDTTYPSTSYSMSANSVEVNNAAVTIGLLKLAGCNIYGRMYRVGKIIAELSGPCLQCRCTEEGVQCHNLHC